MTLRALPRVGLPAALAVLLYGPARAAVDMSGHFIGTLQVNPGALVDRCTIDITQSGTAITIVGN